MVGVHKGEDKVASSEVCKKNFTVFDQK